MCCKSGYERGRQLGYAEAHAEAVALRAEVAALKAKNDRLKAENDTFDSDLQRDHDALVAEVAALKAELAQLKAATAEFHGRVAVLCEALTANSPFGFWVNAPETLRAVEAMLKRE